MNDIKGWEKKYAVTETGDIWSYPKNTGGRGLHNGKWLKLCIVKSGYFIVNLGGKYPKLVHRLVAQTYIPNPKNLPQVNHKNSIRTDNRVENLEWVTNAENCAHMKSQKHSTFGERNTSHKLTEKQVIEIRKNSILGLGGNTHKLSKKYGISTSTIINIMSRRTWQHI